MVAEKRSLPHMMQMHAFTALSRAALRRAPALLLPLLLAACAVQVKTAVVPEAPGFLLGVWHGFIFPVAWVLSLFMADVSVYAVPNNGGWYDFGYFVGIVFLGVGARRSKSITVRRS